MPQDFGQEYRRQNYSPRTTLGLRASAIMRFLANGPAFGDDIMRKTGTGSCPRNSIASLISRGLVEGERPFSTHNVYYLSEEGRVAVRRIEHETAVLTDAPHISDEE